MQYEDILYELRNGAAWIIINRPDKMNAFRGRTCDELIHALVVFRADIDLAARRLRDRVDAAAAFDQPHVHGGFRSRIHSGLREQGHRPA